MQIEVTRCFVYSLLSMEYSCACLIGFGEQMTSEPVTDLSNIINLLR